jgi:acyl-coenzyme A thioesterase PaaI-like protein
MTEIPTLPDGTIDVAGAFAADHRFARTLGPTVVEATDQRAVLRLDAAEPLHNHLGGPHAAALFGLGELAAFALLLRVFGTEVLGGGVPFIKQGSIEFQGLVLGPVLATATLVDDREQVRARFAERGSASFDCEVLFHLEDGGAQTTVMRPRMTLKRF